MKKYMTTESTTMKDKDKQQIDANKLITTK